MLTKEQKEDAINQLSHPYGSVNLLCDGYKITLNVERSVKLTYRVVTYINGWWKGEWCIGSREFPEQKFLNRRETPVATAKQRAAFEKAFGKRAAAKDPFFTAKVVHYDLSWASGKAAINHLCRVCDSIDLLGKEAEQ